MRSGVQSIFAEADYRAVKLSWKYLFGPEPPYFRVKYCEVRICVPLIPFHVTSIYVLWRKMLISLEKKTPTITLDCHSTRFVNKHTLQ